MKLSKSDYMMFLKHPAWVWLKKHEPAKLPPISDNLQAIFDAGHTFEPYAEELFNGVRIDKESENALAETEAAWSGGAKVVFQGRVEFEDLVVVYDILEKLADGSFHLYEIKSSTKKKTKYCQDLAFQKYVLEKAGYKVSQCSLLVANNEYVRNGEIEAAKFVKFIDVTEDIDKLLPEVEPNVSKALKIINSQEMPDISPRHTKQNAEILKDWIKIFHTLGIESLPYDIYQMTPLNADLIGELEDQGIELIKDIPAEFENLAAKHKRQIELMRIGEPVINRGEIRRFLNALKFPLYFLDYETTSNIVPLVDGMKPFQMLPTQYSLHILEEPNGELVHKEFIHRDKSNPSENLVESLRQDIGQTGSVLVWYEHFEKGRNLELGRVLPEQMKFVKALNARVVDLRTPFINQWYEDYRFLSSTSIKNVLPVLVPELSYKALEVQDGQTAQRLWTEAVFMEKYPGKKEQIIDDLLKYCKLDTLAMVRIYEKLLSII